MLPVQIFFADTPHPKQHNVNHTHCGVTPHGHTHCGVTPHGLYIHPLYRECVPDQYLVEEIEDFRECDGTFLSVDQVVVEGACLVVGESG